MEFRFHRWITVTLSIRLWRETIFVEAHFWPFLTGVEPHPPRNLPWISGGFSFQQNFKYVSSPLSLIRTFSQNWHWDILNCRLALTSFKFNWVQIWSLAFIQDFQKNTYIVFLNFFSFLFWLIPFHGGTFGSNYFLGELLCSDFTLPRACNLSPHYAQNVQIWNGPYIQAFIAGILFLQIWNSSRQSWFQPTCFWFPNETQFWRQLRLGVWRIK